MRWRSPTPSTARPPSSTIRSPGRMPARAAGESSSSWTTSSPRGRESEAATARRQRTRPAHDAQVGPPHPPVLDERAEDAPRSRVDRDGEPEADAGDGRVDADDPATRVGERAAGVARVQRRVGLDDVLDEPARPPVARRHRPAERRDHARRHRAREPERVPDRDDELADLQARCVAERRRTELALGRADHGEIAERIAPDDLDRHARAPSTNTAVARSAPATTCADVSEHAVRRERDRRAGATARPAAPSRVTRSDATDGISRSATALTARE